MFGRAKTKVLYVRLVSYGQKLHDVGMERKLYGG